MIDRDDVNNFQSSFRYMKNTKGKGYRRAEGNFRNRENQGNQEYRENCRDLEMSKVRHEGILAFGKIVEFVVATEKIREFLFP